MPWLDIDIMHEWSRRMYPHLVTWLVTCLHLFYLFGWDQRPARVKFPILKPHTQQWYLKPGRPIRTYRYMNINAKLMRYVAMNHVNESLSTSFKLSTWALCNSLDSTFCSVTVLKWEQLYSPPLITVCDVPLHCSLLLTGCSSITLTLALSWPSFARRRPGSAHESFTLLCCRCFASSWLSFFFPAFTPPSSPLVAAYLYLAAATRTPPLTVKPHVPVDLSPASHAIGKNRSLPNSRFHPLFSLTRESSSAVHRGPVQKWVTLKEFNSKKWLTPVTTRRSCS